jgi:hypothetical protein
MPRSKCFIPHKLIAVSNERPNEVILPFKFLEFGKEIKENGKQEIDQYINYKRKYWVFPNIFTPALTIRHA